MQGRIRIVHFIQCFVWSLAFLDPYSLGKAVPETEDLLFGCQLLEIIDSNRREEVQISGARVVVLQPPEKQRPGTPDLHS